jgi:hypothetical protein
MPFFGRVEAGSGTSSRRLITPCETSCAARLEAFTNATIPSSSSGHSIMDEPGPAAVVPGDEVTVHVVEEEEGEPHGRQAIVEPVVRSHHQFERLRL